MKATIEIPDELYRRVKAKSALEGRAVREVTEQLFRRYVAEEASREAMAERVTRDEPRLIAGQPVPPWFGVLGKYARRARRHDMGAIRESIAEGIARDRGL